MWDEERRRSHPSRARSGGRRLGNGELAKNGGGLVIGEVIDEDNFFCARVNQRPERVTIIVPVCTGSHSRDHGGHAGSW